MMTPAAHPFIHWVQGTEIAYLATKTKWVFATAQSVHFMGLSILLGSITLLDLRILGFLRRIPIARLYGLIPLAITGFLIQLLTGIVMFSAEPLGYWTNAAFRLKLALIGVSGLNALWFWAFEHRRLANLPAEMPAGASAKIVATASIAIWALVITLGRFIPYLQGVALPWVPGG